MRGHDDDTADFDLTKLGDQIISGEGVQFSRFVKPPHFVHQMSRLIRFRPKIGAYLNTNKGTPVCCAVFAFYSF